MKLLPLLLALLIPPAVRSQSLPADYDADPALTGALRAIVREVGLDGDFGVGEDGVEQISLAVIDLNGPRPRMGGVNPDNFIYPASVYKMYVAAEVLRQVSAGEYDLAAPVVARAPNVVDAQREIAWDPRPLLQDGDTVTVGYLLDLMITRSDNSAANCLIDLATRPRIDALLHANGWQGSEVTRKFLKRAFEDPGYAEIRGTETSARHAAEFFHRVHANRLADPWVSQQLRSLFGRQLDARRLAAGLPRTAMFYHKTGWWSYWTNDAGLVDDGEVRYVIACFTPLPEAEADPRLARLAAQVHALIRARAGLAP